jgi:hypothetical protein
MGSVEEAQVSPPLVLIRRTSTSNKSERKRIDKVRVSHSQSIDTTGISYAGLT